MIWWIYLNATNNKKVVACIEDHVLLHGDLWALLCKLYILNFRKSIQEFQSYAGRRGVENQPSLLVWLKL